MYQEKTKESEYVEMNDERLSWAFRILIHVQQYPISHNKNSLYCGWKKLGRFIILGYTQAFKIAHAR